MITFDRIVVRFIGTLTLVVPFCIITLTNGRAADQAGQRQGADKSKPPGCPDLSLEGFQKIDFAKIAALQPNDSGTTTLQDDVKTLNDLFHKAPQIAGTVWANYDLVTTQWPSSFPCASKKRPGRLPDLTSTPFPTYLANSTLEISANRRSTQEARFTNETHTATQTHAMVYRRFGIRNCS